MAVMLTTATVFLGAAAVKAQGFRCDNPEESVVATSSPDCMVDPGIEKLLNFQRLADEWRHQSASMSSVTAMAMLRPYQQIIGMGPAAIPFILTELKIEGDDPDQWFWALSTIAEANNLNPPQIKAEDQGDYHKMAQTWLEWGIAYSYGR